MSNKLRPEERLAAEAIVNHYKGKGMAAVYSPPKQDPPDICLHLDANHINIEITQLTENAANNRTQFSASYTRFIMSELQKVKDSMPDNTHLIIRVTGAGVKIGAIRKDFIKFIQDTLVGSGFSKDYYEFRDKTEHLRIEISKQATSGKGKRTFILTNPYSKSKSKDVNKRLESLQYTPLDATLNFLIEERIDTKSYKCRNAPSSEPLYLALIDDYASKFYGCDADHFELYDKAMSNISDFGRFDKVLVILPSGAVKEYTI